MLSGTLKENVIDGERQRRNSQIKEKGMKERRLYTKESCKENL